MTTDKLKYGKNPSRKRRVGHIAKLGDRLENAPPKAKQWRVEFPHKVFIVTAETDSEAIEAAFQDVTPESVEGV